MEPTAQPVGIQTWVDPLPAKDPAVRQLLERVVTLNDFYDPHLALNATIAALVAAGTLETDAPVIDEARAELVVLRPGSADPAARPVGQADPWRSLLARWRASLHSRSRRGPSAVRRGNRGSYRTGILR